MPSLKFNIEVELNVPVGTAAHRGAADALEYQLSNALTIDLLSRLLVDGIPENAEVGKDCYLQINSVVVK